MRGPLSIAYCFCFSNLYSTLVCNHCVFVKSKFVCYLSSSSRIYIVFIYLRKKIFIILIFFELETQKNEGLQLEDRHLHLNINRLAGKSLNISSISFCFKIHLRDCSLYWEILVYICNIILKLSFTFYRTHKY